MSNTADRVKRVRLMLDGFDPGCPEADDLAALCDDIERLDAERDALRAALAPFVDDDAPYEECELTHGSFWRTLAMSKEQYDAGKRALAEPEGE